MRMHSWIGGAGAVLMTVAILVGTAPEAGAKLATNGTRLNGVSDNGRSLNGNNLNGHNLNGVSLNGASLNGESLNGVNLNGENLNGKSLNGQNLNGRRLNGGLQGEAAAPAGATSATRIVLPDGTAFELAEK